MHFTSLLRKTAKSLNVYRVYYPSTIVSYYVYYMYYSIFAASHIGARAVVSEGLGETERWGSQRERVGSQNAVPRVASYIRRCGRRFSTNSRGEESDFPPSGAKLRALELPEFEPQVLDFSPSRAWSGGDASLVMYVSDITG